MGKLEPPLSDGADYATGQTFLHRLFGYRGVVLFPWMARVYDRDLPNRTRPGKGSGNNGATDSSSSSVGDLTTEDDGGGSTVSSQVKNITKLFLFRSYDSYSLK